MREHTLEIGSPGYCSEPCSQVRLRSTAELLGSTILIGDTRTAAELLKEFGAELVVDEIGIVNRIGNSIGRVTIINHCESNDVDEIISILKSKASMCLGPVDTTLKEDRVEVCRAVKDGIEEFRISREIAKKDR